MKQKGMAGQVIRCLLISLAMGMAVMIIGTMITAALISGEYVSESGANIGTAISLFLGAVAAAIFAAATTDKNRIWMYFAGGGAFFLGLLCCGALVFDGVRGSVLMTLMVVAGASLCGALLRVKRGKKMKYRMPKSLR